MNPGAEPLRKAVIVFDTRYGNTRKAAQALAKGISKNPIEVAFFNIHDVEIGELAEYDFIAIGGPTHYATASEPVKSFLKKLDQANPRGKYGFAFDTRADLFWAGSAAGVIERKLRAFGLQIVRTHLSVIVRRAEEGEKSQERGKGDQGRKESEESQRERGKEIKGHPRRGHGTAVREDRRRDRGSLG
jgi:flavorubredoxin